MIYKTEATSWVYQKEGINAYSSSPWSQKLNKKNYFNFKWLFSETNMCVLC